MLPVPVANGRDGFDSRLNMFVGQDLRMRKALANMPNVDAEVRFISDNGRSYPVDLWISWEPESLSSDEEEELKNLVEGTAVGTLLDRRGIRINDWSLSPDLGEKNIWIDGLLNEVGKIVSLDPNSSSP